MVAVNLILSLLAACAAAASYPKLASDLSEQLIECGSDATDDNRLMAHHLDSLDVPFDASDEINVDTYIHIVAESKEESGGHISKAVAEKQFSNLVRDFKGSGFTFTLKDITWTVNPSWSNHREADYNFAMKKALRKGSYRTLNLYYIQKVDAGNSINGYCYYPVARPGSADVTRDGCVQRIDTMEGVGQRGYVGKVTTHEVGHWLSLFHTFEGGCSGPGDHVDDTPAENHKDRDACKERDSCPNVPGVDPIHNYMAYVFDTCRKEFSPGQISRMKKAWNAYRQGK